MAELFLLFLLTTVWRLDEALLITICPWFELSMVSTWIETLSIFRGVGVREGEAETVVDDAVGAAVDAVVDDVVGIIFCMLLKFNNL